MNIPHANPRVLAAELFMEQLHRKLAAEERVEVPETICAVLVEVNRLLCEPPLKEAEAIGIGRSVGGYPAGSPRFRRSSARRIYRKEAR